MSPSIRDYNMQKATDLEVFASAAEEDRIRFSADTDFDTPRRGPCRHVPANGRLPSTTVGLARVSRLEPFGEPGHTENICGRLHFRATVAKTIILTAGYQIHLNVED